MNQQEEKFRFQGIVPFCIEYQKTRSEIDEQYFQEYIKSDSTDSKVGTLYPFSLNYQNFVKFYWRLKQINFSVNISNTYKYSSEQGQCQEYSTETVTLENNKGTISIEPSDALDSLKMRVCKTYDVDYKMKSVFTWPDGNREDIWDASLGLFLKQGDIPMVVAENQGGGTDPENYLYYPRMEFMFYLYTDSWGTFLGYDSEYSSAQEEKTVNIKIDGQTVSNFKIHRVSQIENAMCAIERNSKEFGEWNIDLWAKPQ